MFATVFALEMQFQLNNKSKLFQTSELKIISHMHKPVTYSNGNKINLWQEALSSDIRALCSQSSLKYSSE